MAIDVTEKWDKVVSEEEFKNIATYITRCDKEKFTPFLSSDTLDICKNIF